MTPPPAARPSAPPSDPRRINAMLAELRTMQPDHVPCPNALLPDGPVCPRCGKDRAPSGIDGGSWVHTAPAPRSGDGDPTPERDWMADAPTDPAERMAWLEHQAREAYAYFTLAHEEADRLRAALASQRAARARAEQERAVVVMELARTLMELGRAPDPRMAGVAGDTIDAIRASIAAAPRQFIAVSRPLTAEEAQTAVTAWLSRASGQPEAVGRDA